MFLMYEEQILMLKTDNEKLKKVYICIHTHTQIWNHIDICVKYKQSNHKLVTAVRESAVGFQGKKVVH
jgi:hypothetical protein